jgi:hypothetical protein
MAYPDMLELGAPVVGEYASSSGRHSMCNASDGTVGDSAPRFTVEQGKAEFAAWCVARMAPHGGGASRIRCEPLCARYDILLTYDACGDIGTTFREFDCARLGFGHAVVSETEVPNVFANQA